jgi:hypothetical protein
MRDMRRAHTPAHTLAHTPAHCIFDGPAQPSHLQALPGTPNWPHRSTGGVPGFVCT